MTPDHLPPGAELTVDDAIVSSNGMFEATFQRDGNLVLYDRRSSTRPALWASCTHGKGATRCVMQRDGNLVVYCADGRAVWASDTNGNMESGLVMQDDGNLVIYRANNTPSWASNTVVLARPTERRLGKYRIFERLGEGASGETFRAVDRALGDEVALKLYTRDRTLEAIRADALPLRNIQHGHVLRYLGSELIDGQPYVATELCAGGPLRSHIRGCAGPRAGRWLRQLFDGLRAVHRAGYAHLDIKPENIFLRGDDLVIGDFGNAITRTRVHSPPLNLPRSHHPYYAPEQLLGVDSPACDVWSMGVIACELLAGTRPVSESTVGAVSLPSPWDTVVAGCLQDAPHARMGAEHLCRVLGVE